MLGRATICSVASIARDLRRKLLDDVARDPRRQLAGAGPLVAEPLVFAREAGFEVLHFVGQLGRPAAATACSQSCCSSSASSRWPLRTSDVVDAEPLGFVAKLLALAFEDVALPFVLFDADC